MNITNRNFDLLNHNKANFDAIYHAPDPREYFRILGGLDYVIPDLAKNIFRSLIECYGSIHKKRPRVIDVGCSYGINSALIRFPLDIERLAARYSHPKMHTLSPETLIELDRNYFASWPEQVAADFVGLDSSHAAISYAKRVGLIAGGVTSNLEELAPIPQDVVHLQNIDLVLSTGCVGYISEKTFRRLLALQKPANMPWMVNFVLRMFPFDAIAEELESFGLVTEKVEGLTFVQRRFHSQEEFESSLGALKRRGVDPRNKEMDGLLHAELYVSRPKKDAENLPLSEIFSVTSGADRTYGRRYRSVAQLGAKLMR